MKITAHIILMACAILFFACKNEKANEEKIRESNANQNENTNKAIYKTYASEELNDWLPINILDYVKMEPITNW